MKIETVSIIGLGALGIMYGHHFVEQIGSERVRIVVNQERKERYEKQGIYYNGEKCQFNYVDEAAEMEPADLVIVAVKSTQLEGALETAQHQVGPNTIILSVMNGITSEEILGEHFGSEKVVHCIAQGMDATRDGNELRSQNNGELIIGIDESSKQAQLDAVTAFLDEVKFPYAVDEDILHRLWAKFMLNVGVNQVVMVHETNYGAIHKEGPIREQMIAAMREVLPIAQKEGIDLIEKDVQEYLNVIDAISSEGMPSMRQDGLAKRYSEVELFSGTVLQKAKDYDIDTPVNQQLYDQVKEIEAGY